MERSILLSIRQDGTTKASIKAQVGASRETDNDSTRHPGRIAARARRGWLRRSRIVKNSKKGLLSEKTRSSCRLVESPWEIDVIPNKENIKFQWLCRTRLLVLTSRADWNDGASSRSTAVIRFKMENHSLVVLLRETSELQAVMENVLLQNACDSKDELLFQRYQQSDAAKTKPPARSNHSKP